MLHTLELPDLLDEPLPIETFRGSESLTGSYRFDLELAGDLPPLAEQGSIGKHATFVIRHAEATRAYRGVVASVRTRDRGGNGAGLRVTMVSRLHLLRFARRSRVFQDKRVDEIIDAVLGEWRIPSRWILERELPVRELVTQYEETDLAFIRRLLAESAIMFRLDLDELGREALVLGDTPLCYDGSPLPLSYVGSSDFAPGTSRVTTQLELAHAVRHTAARYREFDPARPNQLLESVRKQPDARDVDLLSLEHYDHHPLHLGTSWEHGASEADRLLAAKRRSAVRSSGSSLSPEVQAGRVIAVEDHPSASLNRRWVVTRVWHEGRRAPRRSRGETYRNRFECVPAEVTYPLARPPRRNVAGHLTATVVGPAGAEIHGDGLARVKVQFHWDREGRGDDSSSCWLRTMQAWGGEGWGAQFLPRVGMEVVVAFEGGDPNKPFVLGCVYNGTHPTPFSLADDPTRSGFRTRSTPASDGFNELSFRDLAGEEEVYLHAERDLTETIGHDHMTEVRGRRTETVGGDATTRVTGSRTIETVGSSTEKTAGDCEHHVGGQLRGRFGAGRHTVVAGDDVARVTGRSVTTVKSQLALNAGDRIGISAGTPTKPGGIDITAHGNTMVGSGMGLTLRAEERITLACGETILELTPNGLSIRAPNVTASAAKRLTAIAKGTSLRMEERVQIAGEQVRLYSASACLELDENAHVDGQLVKLACGGELERPTEDGTPPPTRPLRLRVAGPDFVPHARKAFVVKAGGARVEGTTDESGSIDVVIPADATGADVTVWLGKRGQSECRHYAIALTDLEPVTTLQGLQVRLRHLGYYHREPSGALDPPTRAALKQLQRQHGLGHTGDADDATRAKILELHGS